MPNPDVHCAARELRTLAPYALIIIAVLLVGAFTAYRWIAQNSPRPIEASVEIEGIDVPMAD